MLPDGLLPDNDYYLSQTPDNGATDNDYGSIFGGIIGLCVGLPFVYFIGRFIWHILCATQ